MMNVVKMILSYTSKFENITIFENELNYEAEKQ